MTRLTPDPTDEEQWAPGYRRFVTKVKEDDRGVVTSTSIKSEVRCNLYQILDNAESVADDGSLDGDLVGWAIVSVRSDKTDYLNAEDEAPEFEGELSLIKGVYLPDGKPKVVESNADIELSFDAVERYLQANLDTSRNQALVPLGPRHIDEDVFEAAKAGKNVIQYVRPVLEAEQKTYSNPKD